MKSKLAVKLILDSLNAAINDPINNLKVGSEPTFGNIVAQIAVSLVSSEQSGEFKQLSDQLVSKVFLTLTNVDDLTTEKNMQIVFTNIHKLTLNFEEK